MASAHLSQAIGLGLKAQKIANGANGSLFPRWQHRRFRRVIESFVSRLEHLPYGEAEHLSGEEVNDLAQVVNSVAASAETMMSGRLDSSIQDVEQDRFVVTEIYKLRQIVEELGRPHLTVGPALAALRSKSGRRPSRS